MLQIKDLTITHKKDSRTILSDFNFVLNKGDKAVILGEEGNGKSTLLKLIYDVNLVYNYIEYSGEIIKRNMKLGYLAQELREEERKQTIYEFCSCISCFFELSPKELSNIALLLGLSVELFYSEQVMETLSGGEKVKLQLAKILMIQPDVILLDEPSNDIDINTLEWLQCFINGCQVPILFVSHDEILIEKTANLIIQIEQIHRKTLPKYTIAKMDYIQYKNKRISQFIHQEKTAKKERSEYEKQQERFRQIHSKVEHEQRTISRQDPHGGQLLKKKMKQIKSMEKRFNRAYETMTEMPEIEETIFIKFPIGNAIPRGKIVLDYKLDKLQVNNRILSRNIQIRIMGDEKACIIGKNGVGKTTLLRKIEEELRYRTDIRIGYMPQNYEELLEISLTPIEFLSVKGDKEEKTRIRTYLGSMKYTADEMGHAISQLSGGQKAKLLLLKMSLEGCNMLILDEPTRNFSPLSNPTIREVLIQFDGTILAISHDRKFIDEVCNIVYELTEEGLKRKE